MADHSAFDRALADFKAGLKKKDQDRFKATTKESMLKEIEKLQQDQQSRRLGQNLARVKPFVEAMGQFGKVIEVFSNVSEMVAFVWGPMKLLLQIAGAFAKAFHELLDVYEKLGESIPMVLQFEKLFREDVNMRRVLSNMWKDILEFHRQALKYFQQPMWRQLFQATWDTYKSRFSPLIENIRGHGHLIQTQAALSQIEDFRRDQDLRDAQFNKITESQEMQRLTNLKAWLNPPSIENDQYELSKVWKRYPGSGRWLLQNQSMKEWLDPLFPTIPPLLWMHGMPGAGKTVLSSIIVDELQNMDFSPDVLYFYCKHGNSERNNYASIGRCFLSQLLLKHKDILVPYFYERFSSSPDPVLGSLAMIELLLDVALRNCTDAYIIIDGIDECDRHERRKITQWFRNLVEDLQPPRQDRVRCLFVSQDDGIARKDFKGLEAIRIERQDNQADIHTFSQLSAGEIQAEIDIPDKLKIKVASKVEEAADAYKAGMFLLAKLIVENLMQQTCVEDVEHELEDETLPRELKQAYSRITSRVLDNATSSTKDSFLFILRWLVSAKRPIQWHEIQAAKAINVDGQSVELERRKIRKDIKDLCGPLVEIRQNGTVELVHLTAKFFLIEEKHVDVARVEVSNTALCLDYLNMPGFRRDSVAIDFIPSGYYAFMDYAVPYWLRHFENGLTQADYDSDLLRELREPIEAFLTIHFTAPTKQFYISQDNVKKLQFFREFEFYDNLETAVVSARKDLTFLGEMKPGEVALDLASIVRTVRGHLETAYLNATGKKDCCPSSTMGMSTIKELIKHKKDVHTIIQEDEEEDFPSEIELAPPQPSKSAETTRKGREPKDPGPPKVKRPRITEYRCPQCQKVFSKKFNLDSHMITHSGRRDFLCNICSMGFARENDRIRHQATHKEKEYECGGTLYNGQPWGCHKKFARADTLKSHHNSAVGKDCIQPFLQQQQETLYGPSQ
ncbi:Ankyrin repeat-containing protein [Apiospora hydei]|uniref:Ankyrin repeat-containing protein n=1 Tax=Apiospora hydei TaxID=1337664 RepID=A0ABR1WMB8_9PEZI